MWVFCNIQLYASSDPMFFLPHSFFLSERSSDMHTQRSCLVYKALLDKERREENRIAFVAQHTHVCHPPFSPLPSCTLSITERLGLGDDGWGQTGPLPRLLLRPVSPTGSPVPINLVPRPLKPLSNNVTALQTGRNPSGNQREKKENKLFTLTSNAPQRVVKRKSQSERRPGMSAYRQEARAGGGERLQEKDELMLGGGRENHLFLRLIPLDLCDNLKNNIRQQIESHQIILVVNQRLLTETNDVERTRGQFVKRRCRLNRFTRRFTTGRKFRSVCVCYSDVTRCLYLCCRHTLVTRLT